MGCEKKTIPAGSSNAKQLLPLFHAAVAALLIAVESSCVAQNMLQFPFPEVAQVAEAVTGAQPGNVEPMTILLALLIVQMNPWAMTVPQPAPVQGGVALEGGLVNLINFPRSEDVNPQSALGQVYVDTPIVATASEIALPSHFAPKAKGLTVAPKLTRLPGVGVAPPPPLAAHVVHAFPVTAVQTL